MRRVQPRQLLVLQQHGTAGWSMARSTPERVDGHPHPVGGERLQQLGRGVRVDRTAAERGGDPGRQARPAGAAGTPGPGRGPSSSASSASCTSARHGSRERSSRPRPGRPRTPPRPAARTGPDARPPRSAAAGRRARSTRRPEDLTGLGEDRARPGRTGWPARWRGGRRGPARAGNAGAGSPAQPGPGPRQGRRFARPALPRAQQGLGQGGVVAAVHPHPGPQQRRVDRGRVAQTQRTFALAGPLVLRHRRREIV